MLPAVTAVIEPAHSLEAMLHSVRSGQNHELNFIGPGLESSVRASIQESGVLARKIVRGNVDCDIAFILDDVLFLCECKCRFTTADFGAYADQEEYLVTEAIRQHKRTCDYFADHLNLVRNSLKREPDWYPKSIERIIITSTKLGRPMQVDGYLITDHHAIHAYFSRQPAKILIGSHELFEISDERLQGPATAEGLIAYLCAPQVIEIHRSYIEQRSMPLPVGEQKVTFRDCEAYGEVRLEGDDDEPIVRAYR
jgi:hypothetical protein